MVVEPPVASLSNARLVVFSDPRCGRSRHGQYRVVSAMWDLLWLGRGVYLGLSREWLLDSKLCFTLVRGRCLHPSGTTKGLANAWLEAVCVLGVFLTRNGCVPPAKQVPPRRPTDSRMMKIEEKAKNRKVSVATGGADKPCETLRGGTKTDKITVPTHHA